MLSVSECTWRSVTKVKKKHKKNTKNPPKKTKQTNRRSVIAAPQSGPSGNA